MSFIEKLQSFNCEELNSFENMKFKLQVSVTTHQFLEIKENHTKVLLIKLVTKLSIVLN